MYTKSTHFCALFVEYMKCLSVLCDLYILYTFIYFLYSINVAYINLEQNSVQKVYKSKSMSFAPQLFWIQCDIHLYIQNIDCNLLNQHNNCIQKLHKVYTCCIWLALICTWICDFYIRVHFKNVEYKLYNYFIIMNKK